MEERLEKIINYINNYRKYSKNDEIINYCQVFDLNKDMDRNKLLNEIKSKKLKIIFHPDLKAYIPAVYKEEFQLLSNFVIEIENILSSDYKKEEYDKKLEKQMIVVTNEEFVSFNQIVIDNISKYGFFLTCISLKMIINNNDFKGITRDNNNRNDVIKLGCKKVNAIINAFNNNNKVTSLEWNIVRYFSFLLYQNNFLMQKMNIYLDACHITTNKYGLSQLEWAINESLNISEKNPDTDKYKGFTNDSLARTNLREKLKNPKDLLFLSKIYLNINMPNDLEMINLNTLPDEEIIRTFVKIIGKNLEKDNNINYQR